MKKKHGEPITLALMILRKSYRAFGFLDSIDSTKEVYAIIPNNGFVKATILLDSGFTGIKGLSVITKKVVESEQVNGITIKYGPMVDKGLMRCVNCGKTFVKEYNKCPYCGSSSLVLNP